MKSRVTSKRFGSTNENRASHFASPIGRETICMYANSVWVNCITWHWIMTKSCWFHGCRSTTGPRQWSWRLTRSPRWWLVGMLTGSLCRVKPFLVTEDLLTARSAFTQQKFTMWAEQLFTKQDQHSLDLHSRTDVLYLSLRFQVTYCVHCRAEQSCQNALYPRILCRLSSWGQLLGEISSARPHTFQLFITRH